MATFLVAVVLTQIVGVAGATSFTTGNTVIVLPTTKVVNNTPLHINEDAIAGAQLGAWIEWKSIQINNIMKSYTFSYTVHSIPIWQNNGTYYLLKRDMPDVGLELSTVPTKKSFVISTDFDKVTYNKTSKTIDVKAGAVKVLFTNAYPVVDLGLNGKYVVANDNITTIYAYDHENKTNFFVVLGGSFKIDGWTITVKDFDPDHGKLLLEITQPNGDTTNAVAYVGSSFVWYVKDGKICTGNTTNITGFLKTGVSKLAYIKFNSIFDGNTYKYVITSYDYYQLDKMYKDGEKFSGNWVWDIISPTEFALVYNANVSLKDGGEIDFPFADLKLVSHVDNTTHYITFEREYAKSVSLSTKDVVLPKPENLVITDEKAVSGMPAGNIIVVGGWVSNKFWSVLEKYYPDDVAEMKEEVMKNGYVIKFLPNPVDKDGNIVVIAGKTYVQTGMAVQMFIQNYILSGQ